MKKQEERLKMEEIKRLSAIKEYKKALMIIETMEVDKIKTTKQLNIVAKVYEKNKLYEDAMNMYLRIYNRLQTKNVLYKLVHLTLKIGKIEEAEEYFQEYVNVSLGDYEQFLLKYMIDMSKGASVEVLINSLEKYKEFDYNEKWALELAKLYRIAGNIDRCVKECEDIMLWFGEGIYVEGAKILKDYCNGKLEDIRSLLAKAEKVEGNSSTAEFSKEHDEQKEHKLENNIEDEGYFINGIDIGEIFEKIISVSGVKKQVLINNIIESFKQIIKTGNNHFIITGDNEPSKTEVVKVIAMILFKLELIKTKKIAKIEASKLNKVDLLVKKARLIDGCLLIEKASELNKASIEQIINLLKEYHGEIFVMLEDNKMLMDNFLSENQELDQCIYNNIRLDDDIDI